MFSKLDANTGFHQIKLTDESKLLTTFITPCGRYYYNRFPEHFQMQLHGVLENQVVYGKDFKKHDETLNQVFERLSKAKITLNKEKCQLRKPEISFLGQSVGKDGIKQDPAKVSAVVDIEIP